MLLKRILESCPSYFPSRIKINVSDHVDSSPTRTKETSFEEEGFSFIRIVSPVILSFYPNKLDIIREIGNEVGIRLH